MNPVSVLSGVTFQTGSTLPARTKDTADGYEGPCATTLSSPFQWVETSKHRRITGCPESCVYGDAHQGGAPEAFWPPGGGPMQAPERPTRRFCAGDPNAVLLYNIIESPRPESFVELLPLLELHTVTPLSCRAGVALFQALPAFAADCAPAINDVLAAAVEWDDDEHCLQAWALACAVASVETELWPYLVNALEAANKRHMHPFVLSGCEALSRAAKDLDACTHLRHARLDEVLEVIVAFYQDPWDFANPERVPSTSMVVPPFQGECAVPPPAPFMERPPHPWASTWNDSIQRPKPSDTTVFCNHKRSQHKERTTLPMHTLKTRLSRVAEPAHPPLLRPGDGHVRHAQAPGKIASRPDEGMEVGPLGTREWRKNGPFSVTHVLSPRASPVVGMEARVARWREAVWIRNVLDAHNSVRAQYGAAPLEWSLECAAMARDLADSGTVLSLPEEYGHNLGQGVGSFPNAWDVVGKWCQGCDSYRFGKKDAGPTDYAGERFSQVVWQHTTHVGMHFASGGSGLVAAVYFPRGNAEGGFSAGVLPRGTVYVPPKPAPASVAPSVEADPVEEPPAPPAS